MSFELGRAFRKCGIETKGRREVLSELIAFCDDATGEVRMGRHALAFGTGLSVKGALRLVRELAEDPDLAGLVTRETDLTGHGDIVCRLDMARLRPLLAARGLCPGWGGKATPETLATVAVWIRAYGDES